MTGLNPLYLIVHFFTPWKLQKTKDGIEMEHWTKIL